MSKRALTPKQERFCQEYLISLNATQAAKAAGYSAKSAMELGYQLLQNPSVKAYIDARLKKKAKRYDLAADRILDELASIAYSRMSDYLEFNESGVRRKDSVALTRRQAAAIAEVSELMNEHGGTTKFRLHDKVRALELLGKYRKLFTDKHEHSGTVSLEGLVAGSNESEKE